MFKPIKKFSCEFYKKKDGGLFVFNLTEFYVLLRLYRLLAIFELEVELASRVPVIWVSLSWTPADGSQSGKDFPTKIHMSLLVALLPKNDLVFFMYENFQIFDL